MEPTKPASAKKNRTTATLSRRALGNSAERPAKAEKLVCRYCGSDDLAPSFVKRRDRRCRKCFSKLYGSEARARKTKLKK